MKPAVALREIRPEDLQILFELQLDQEANRMAAFTARDPSDRAAFDAHMAKILADESTLNRAVLLEGVVIGSVASFMNGGHREVCYWIDRAYWGRGIASAALGLLLEIDGRRPIYAGLAADNVGSKRVLEKAGFKLCEELRGFSNARQEEIDELLMVLV